MTPSDDNTTPAVDPKDETRSVIVGLTAESLADEPKEGRVARARDTTILRASEANNDTASPEDIERAKAVWKATLDANPNINDPSQTLKSDQTLSLRPGDLPTDFKNLLPTRSIQTASQRSSAKAGGQGFADYEIREAVGEGGMGVVFKADQRSLQRQVAVKMLHPDYETDKELVRLFLREAVITGKLEHPNIVPVYDLGQSHKDQPYMGMKLVRGESFKDWLNKHKQDFSRRLRGSVDILVEVCDAVAYAHSHGILHRDIKPANVMLGEFGEVLLMDWGLAYETGEPNVASGDGSQQGLSSSPAGTPAYMSPEQAGGEDAKLGPWSDVYLLGAVLYEVLCGSSPHQGSSLMAVLVAAQKGQVTPPDQRLPSRSMPQDLVELCMDALKPEPSERLQSAQDFKDRLLTHRQHREAQTLLNKAAVIVRAIREHERASESNGGDGQLKRSRLDEAEWLAKQAQEMWPDSAFARQLRQEIRVLQVDRALDLGDAQTAHELASEWDGQEGFIDKRLAPLKKAAERQLARRRGRIAGTLALAVVVLIGAFWGRRVLPDIQRANAKKMAQETFPSKVEEVWQNLDQPASSLVVDLLELQELARQADWPLADTDARMLALLGAWERLREGENAACLSILRPFLRDTSPFQAALHQELSAEQRAAALGNESSEFRLLLQGLLISCQAQRLSPGQGPEHKALVEGEDAGAVMAVLADRRSSWRAAEPLTMRIQLLRASRQTVLKAFDREGQELWSFPPEILPNLSRLRTPLLLTEQGQAYVVVAWGSEILVLAADNGQILKRLRFQDECAGLIPLPVERGKARFGAIQRCRFGRCMSRVVPATLSGLEHRVVGGSRRSSMRTVRLQARRAMDNSLLVGEMLRTWRLQQLRRLQQVDPTQPFWPLERALINIRKAQQETLLADDVPKLWGAPLSALEWVHVAQEMADFGQPKLALRALKQATWAQIHDGVNPDLNSLVAGNPASVARSLAEQAYSQDNLQAFKDFMGYSRAMATVLEGDRYLIKLEEDWRRQQGDQLDAAELSFYQGRARKLGGAFFAPPSVIRIFDFVLTLSIVLPIVLLASVLILIVRFRPSQVADLRALGFRSEEQRWAAFLTHPILRLNHSFLAYATPSQRLFLFLGSLLNLMTKVFMATALAAFADISSMPKTLGLGAMSHPTVQEFTQLALNTQELSVRQAHLKLLAEAALFEGQGDKARVLLEEILEDQPGDSFALNNKGLLLEGQGQTNKALVLYQQAGLAPGEDGAVGRFNAARVQGQPRPELPRQYRAFFVLEPEAARQRPLRQLAKPDDLLDVMNLGPSTFHLMFQKLDVLLDEGRHLLKLVPVLKKRGLLPGVMEVPEQWVLIHYFPSFFIFLALASLLALPFGTQALSRRLPEPTRRWLSRLGRGFNLILPGSLWLVRGQVVVGSCLLILVPSLILGIWRGSHAGLMEILAFQNFAQSYGGLEVDQLTVTQPQYLAAVFSWIMLLFLYPTCWGLTWLDWRREQEQQRADDQDSS